MSRYRQWEVVGDVGLLIPSGGLSLPPYSTTFSGGNEDPISEGGVWVNGLAVGEDWGDCAITNGIAHGKHVPTQFADPTAILTGTWPADHEAEGIIQGVDTQGGTCGAEVEIRTRSVVSAGVNRGIEFLWSTRTASNYLQIVRWNGPLGDFDLLYNTDPGVTPTNGFTLRGRSVGTTHTVEILNGVGSIVFTDAVTDATFSDGNPGMGFYIGSSCLGDLGPEDDFGFESYAAREVAA